MSLVLDLTHSAVQMLWFITFRLLPVLFLGTLPFSLPLTLGCAAFGWFTGRGPLRRARLKVIVHWVVSAIERSVDTYSAFAHSGAGLAAGHTVRAALPYIVKAAVAIFALWMFFRGLYAISPQLFTVFVAALPVLIPTALASQYGMKWTGITFAASIAIYFCSIIALFIYMLLTMHGV